ncbi:MAG: hypothetical protein J6U14_01890 [Bacteroidaceae bacterium]|nr:hypothetical protein [Bacteroidaceae bacterium]
MRSRITYILVLLLCYSGLVVQAQDEVEVTLQADVVNQFIWRGYKNGHASIQPTLGISWKGLSLSAWGSVGITDSSDVSEIDLEASYTIGGLTLKVTDYWTDSPNPKYFDYHSSTTSHVFEAGLCYDFGLLSLSWQTFFAGQDYFEQSNKRTYSSYVEMCVPFYLATCEWEGRMGVVPYASDFYSADGFRVTNLSLMASKELPITDKFSLPVFAQLVGNPNIKQLFFVFGLTIGF